MKNILNLVRKIQSFRKVLKKSTFFIPPLNPPGGTCLNPASYNAPIGGFGGDNGLFQQPLKMDEKDACKRRKIWG
jgi:hypothetical protein